MLMPKTANLARQQNTQSELHTLLQLYTSFTGFTTEFIPDPALKTNPTISSGPENLYCQLLRNGQAGETRCRLQMLKGGKMALELGEPYISVCHAGLVEWAVPVLSRGTFQGVVISGKVLLRKPDDKAIDEIINKSLELELDREDLRQALRQLPVISEERAQAAAELLFQMLCYSRIDDTAQPKKQSDSWQKPGVSTEAISQPKANHFRNLNLTATEETVEKYPKMLAKKGLLHEKKLVGYIRLGEREKVKKLLDHILEGIFLADSNSLATTKIQVMELLATISRMGLQAGASESLMEQYFRAVDTLKDAENTDLIRSQATEVLDQMINEIHSSRDQSKYLALTQASRYLKDHYREDIDPEKLAQIVNHDNYTLNQLFREELGITIAAYLTEIRISTAMDLLNNTDLMVKQIAQKTGYREAGYFTRVFKKNTGVSPTEYRNKNKTLSVNTSEPPSPI